MQVSGHVYHASYSEVPHNLPTPLSNSMKLITYVAISALLILCAAISACVLLIASVEIIIAAASTVLVAAIGVIVGISRFITDRNKSESPPDQQDIKPFGRCTPRRKTVRPPSSTLKQMDGRIGAIQLSSIHKLKLMAQSPSKQYGRLYDCLIISTNGTSKHYTFAPEVYNAFLAALPAEKKNTY